jgi:hypothetical protein
MRDCSARGKNARPRLENGSKYGGPSTPIRRESSLGFVVLGPPRLRYLLGAGIFYRFCARSKRVFPEENGTPFIRQSWLKPLPRMLNDLKSNKRFSSSPPGSKLFREIPARRTLHRFLEKAAQIKPSMFRDCLQGDSHNKSELCTETERNKPQVRYDSVCFVLMCCLSTRARLQILSDKTM